MVSSFHSFSHFDIQSIYEIFFETDDRRGPRDHNRRDNYNNRDKRDFNRDYRFVFFFFFFWQFHIILHIKFDLIQIWNLFIFSNDRGGEHKGEHYNRDRNYNRDKSDRNQQRNYNNNRGAAPQPPARTEERDNKPKRAPVQNPDEIENRMPKLKPDVKPVSVPNPCILFKIKFSIKI